MHNLGAAVNELQLAAGNLQPGFARLAEARKLLFSAIREIMVECATSPNMEEGLTTALKQYDKLYGNDG